MKRKLMALVMAVAMMVCLAVPVFAYEDSTGAVIGSNEYDYIGSAVAAAKDGDTVVMIKDTMTFICILPKRVTINLNGRTLSNSSPLYPSIDINNQSNLTITGEGTVDGGSSSALNNQGVLIIAGGDTPSGSLTIKSNGRGDVDCPAKPTIMNNGRLSISGNSTKIVGDGIAAIRNFNGGTVSISGGRIEGSIEVATGTDVGSISITGGTFTVDPSAYVADGYCAKYDAETALYSIEELETFPLTRVWIEGEKRSTTEEGNHAAGESISLSCSIMKAYIMSVRLNGIELPYSREESGSVIFNFKMPAQSSTMEVEYTRRTDIPTYLLLLDGEEFGYYVEGEEDEILYERKPGYNTVVKLNDTPIAPTESNTYDGTTYDNFRFTMPATDSNLTCEYVAQSGGSSYSGTTYTVLESKNLNWNGQSAGITARIANDIANYTGTTVDGITLTKNQVSVTSGSTIVNLKPAFLKTLSAGTHTMRVNFLDGYTDVSFTVKGTNTTNPETGANDFVGIAVALCAAAAISAAIISKKH